MSQQSPFHSGDRFEEYNTNVSSTPFGKNSTNQSYENTNKIYSPFGGDDMFQSTSLFGSSTLNNEFENFNDDIFNNFGTSFENIENVETLSQDEKTEEIKETDNIEKTEKEIIVEKKPKDPVLEFKPYFLNKMESKLLPKEFSFNDFNHLMIDGNAFRIATGLRIGEVSDEYYGNFYKHTAKRQFILKDKTFNNSFYALRTKPHESCPAPKERPRINQFLPFNYEYSKRYSVDQPLFSFIDYPLHRISRPLIDLPKENKKPSGLFFPQSRNPLIISENIHSLSMYLEDMKFYKDKHEEISLEISISETCDRFVEMLDISAESLAIIEQCFETPTDIENIDLEPITFLELLFEVLTITSGIKSLLRFALHSTKEISVLIMFITTILLSKITDLSNDDFNLILRSYTTNLLNLSKDILVVLAKMFVHSDILELNNPNDYGAIVLGKLGAILNNTSDMNCISISKKLKTLVNEKYPNISKKFNYNYSGKIKNLNLPQIQKNKNTARLKILMQQKKYFQKQNYDRQNRSYNGEESNDVIMFQFQTQSQNT
eukprot:TRINITY_DN2835_c0_g1_i2.p2 TRINITY_DN2835_c0_g1~~TRINITY_DN2835_c0_g1_i2.p2  ORF type:complete len:546 (+),score=165.45 TRINITY_DN2835_c0_g1_i2:1952-3589(+)